MSSDDLEWTEPFHGVQHLGQYGLRRYWCSVVDRNSFAELMLYAPGGALTLKPHTSVEAARRAGRKYMKAAAPHNAIVR